MNIWLFTVASFLASLYALWTRLSNWMFIAALVYAPLALYLFATPRFRWQGPLAWALLGAAAFALYRGRRSLAALLAAPAFLLALYVGWLVNSTNP
ncbi:MAG: hypothetical protein IT318_07470 [Anaerolineales bacterium]|nr:hypothetical protein [Anaerolineales bacterium]